MKIQFILLVFIILHSVSIAQVVDGEKILRTKDTDTTSGWKKGGMFNAGFSQTSLTNWAAGGPNFSTTINVLFNIFANFRDKKQSWYNSFETGFGGMKEWYANKSKIFRKTDDKIDLTSKYGRKAFKKWYYAALFNFRTQMTEGYTNPTDTVSVSDIFAPAYLIFSMGMDYQYKNLFSIYIAPLTSKMTFVHNQRLADAGAFGVEKAIFENEKKIQDGKKYRGEWGGYLRMSITKDLIKNVSLQTKADFFSNYKSKPENIDVVWENLLTMKVNKYLGITISTQLIYDDDIIVKVDKDSDGKYDSEGDVNGPRVQFKEIASVGLTYKF